MHAQQLWDCHHIINTVMVLCIKIKKVSNFQTTDDDRFVAMYS